MTREEVIQGLQFTIDMFLFDPSTGEAFTEPRNDMDKTTIDACKCAVELLRQEPCEDVISRARVVDWLHNCTDDSIEHAIDSNLEFIPSVTPKPKMGRWIFPNPSTEMICECSLCGGNGRAFGKDNYCPNCGAEMIKPQESEK